jgi:hypothetical protein
MNRKIAFMMTAALLLGTATLPGVSVRAAVAAAGVQATAATQKASPTLSDQFFRVEWTAKPGPDGSSRITGYVYNQYGEAAQNVELKISELDASGHAASSVTRPVFGTVPAEDRAYFDVKAPSSSSYQVAVQSFDFLELEN